MNIADAIKLSIGGYSKEQILEVKEMEKEAPEILDLITKNGKSFDEAKEIFTTAKELSGSDKKDPAPDDPKPAPDAGGNDQTAELQKQMEELKKQNEELTNNIKKMQEENRNKDLGGNLPNPDEEIGALFSQFM